MATSHSIGSEPTEVCSKPLGHREEGVVLQGAGGEVR